MDFHIIHGPLGAVSSSSGGTLGALGRHFRGVLFISPVYTCRYSSSSEQALCGNVEKSTREPLIAGVPRLSSLGFSAKNESTIFVQDRSVERIVVRLAAGADFLDTTV